MGMRDRRTKPELLARIAELEGRSGSGLRAAVDEALGVLEAESVVVTPDKRVAVLLLAGLIDGEKGRVPCGECGQGVGLESTLVSALKEFRISMKELRPGGDGASEAVKAWLGLMQDPV